MIYTKIEILGLRGFSEKQTLTFGMPNGNIGSGLTIIVGPNNSGKSTIYEALRAVSSNTPPGFSSGQRNLHTGSKIEISITRNDETVLSLVTSKISGGSQTQFEPVPTAETKLNFFTLPSRRGFSPFFGKDTWTRQQYTDSATFTPQRSVQHDQFFRRLFKIQEQQETFDTYNGILAKVLGYVPSWCLELSDTQQFFLKFDNNGSAHNSDGSGEGLLSIFTIVDALYDSKSEDLIFIDEPELSLHPSLQKKLLNLILEYSADRQIIISTHSPYFISWDSLENNGRIARTVKEQIGTKIYELKQVTASAILCLLSDLHNPHTLGLDAKEVFFLNDKVILVEGQEDVIFLNKILDLTDKTLNGDFYGWGIGGAEKAEKVLGMLTDLGFKKVSVIFDNNKKDKISALKEQYPNYFFTSIPTDDVREKPEKNIEGLIDNRGKKINEKYVGDIDKLCSEINNYLTD